MLAGGRSQDGGGRGLRALDLCMLAEGLVDSWHQQDGLWGPRVPQGKLPSLGGWGGGTFIFETRFRGMRENQATSPRVR